MKSIELNSEQMNKVLLEDPFFSKILQLQFNIKSSQDACNPHIRLSEVYLKTKNPALALIHLKIANKWRDFRSLLLLARCYRDLGDGNLYGMLDTYNSRPKFMSGILPLLISSSDFKAGFFSWLNYRDVFEKVDLTQESKLWNNFLAKHADNLIEYFSQETEAKLAFSEKFPHSLTLFDGQDISRLLTISKNKIIALIFTSWDLANQLKKDNIFRSEVYQQFPLWLLNKIQDEDSTVYLDSSEEAPVIRSIILDDFSKQIYGKTSLMSGLYFLSANQKNQLVNQTLCNIYPVNLICDSITQNLNNLPAFLPKLDKPLVSFLAGIPRPHRAAFMILMNRYNMLDDFTYSWWGLSNQKSTSSLDKYLNSMKDIFSSISFSEEDLDWLINLPEVKIGSNTSNTHFLCADINISFLHSARFHVVSETDFPQTNVLRFTEKTFKPIIAGVPFLMLGVSGIVAELRSIGIDMLDDYIDHSYDKIIDPSERMLAIFKELNRLKDENIMPVISSQVHRSNLNCCINWAQSHKKNFFLDFFQKACKSHQNQL